MTDRDAFLAAILARPDDDLPRLVYAEWLDEQGDHERAEFVRVQCEMAEQRDPTRRPPAGEENDRRQDWLERRERELLDVAAVEDWASLPAAWVSEWWWTRGFVSRVTCDWPAWRDHGDAIRRAQPVERVTLTGDPDWEWFDSDMILARLLPGGEVFDTSEVPDGANILPYMLRLRWPAVPGELGPVAFELPPEPPNPWVQLGFASIPGNSLPRPPDWEAMSGIINPLMERLIRHGRLNFPR